jgi:lysophospholipase L1-like esterase
VSDTKKTRKSVVVAAMFVLALVAFLATEIAARVAYKNSDALREFGPVPLGLLDDYEMRDPKAPANWKPRPGYRKTLGELIEEKRRLGKLLAVEQLERTGQQLKIGTNDVVMQINQDGYKGPDLDRTGTRFRILTIGDSCTFGTMFDHYSYPRALERALVKEGFLVEVINGGVEGYSPKNVTLYRMEEFKALRPQITTIYIGWNALYNEHSWPPQLVGTNEFLYSWRAIKKIANRVSSAIDPQGTALRSYMKPKRADDNDPLLKRIEGTRPIFMGDVEAIILEMRSAGSQVVLITLPGLFATEERPSERALQIGHLPTFTDNPYVLAKMAEEYNLSLRSLAEKHNVLLVDLEAWANEAFRPKDEFFFDSVHLYEAGQERLGRYLATKLSPLVAQTNKPGSQR